MISERERKEKSLLGLFLCCSRDLVYWGTAGGITCRVPVSGQGLGLISMRSLHQSLHNPSSIPGSVIYCLVYSVCPVWSPGSHWPHIPLLHQSVAVAVVAVIREGMGWVMLAPVVTCGRLGGQSRIDGGGRG